MKLNLNLNSSPSLDTKEAFAYMLRLIADLLEQAPTDHIESPVYDRSQVRVGTFTLTEESHAAVLH